jgi:hypothetical protein
MIKKLFIILCADLSLQKDMIEYHINYVLNNIK